MIKLFCAIVIFVGVAVTACAPLVTPSTAPQTSAPISQSPTSAPTVASSPRANLPNATATSGPTRTVQRDVTYCAVNGVELKIDLYFPAKADKPAPAAIYIHGGAWMHGDKMHGNLIPFSDLASRDFSSQQRIIDWRRNMNSPL